MHGAAGTNIVECEPLRISRNSLSATRNQNSAIGKHGGVVLPACKVHRCGPLPLRAGIVQIDDLCKVCREMRARIQPAAAIENLSAVVHYRRRIIAESCVAYWARRPDRKSTRLNSSHLGISYAVFCLKKKKRSQGYDDNRQILSTSRLYLDATRDG